MAEIEGALAITTQHDASGAVVLSVTGELDHYTGPALRQAVEEVLRTPGTGLIADLSGVQYCDSTGMTVIITTYHRAEAAGSPLVVAGLSPGLAELFRVAGLDQIFPLYPTVRDAVGAFRGTGGAPAPGGGLRH
ncbi:STAS domain-containing protein [Streptomyces sp. NPDC006193]|uniref:STAS domain-containing protein n=1 Tax=Streptomyces sp. NPDC006193 TaxID=3155717 RepID=UPI0033A8F9F4